MSKDRHVIVWIDQRECRIITLSADALDEATVHPSGPTSTPPHRSLVDDGKRAPVDIDYYEKVAAALAHASEILLTGPGSAKVELSTYLQRTHKVLANRIVAVEAVDHPTSGELKNIALRAFRNVDRMLPQRIWQERNS